VNHPLLHPQGQLHSILPQLLERAVYGSSSDSKGFLSNIQSLYNNGDFSKLIDRLGKAQAEDRRNCFLYPNGSINSRALDLFKTLMYHENTELRQKAREFYFQYLKTEELKNLNGVSVNHHRLRNVYDLMAKYFTTDDAEQKDELSLKIAIESGIAYSDREDDQKLPVDHTGAGPNAQLAPLHGFISLLKRSNAGQMLFEMVHKEKEGFLERNKTYVPKKILEGDVNIRNQSTPLSEFLARRFIRNNDIGRSNPLSFNGVLHEIQPGNALAPQLLTLPGFNVDDERSQEIRFLQQAGGLNEHDATNFSFNFQSLTRNLFSTLPETRQKAVRDYALAYSLLKFRRDRIQAATISDSPKLTIMGYELLSSDKNSALKYADRQIENLQRVLNERVLNDENVEIAFRQILKDNYPVYLKTIAMSQLAGEQSQFEGAIRRLSDRFSSYNMGLGSPQMPPVSVSSLVNDPKILKRIYRTENGVENILKSIRINFVERYGEPAPTIDQLKEDVFTNTAGIFSFKPNARINPRRGPQTIQEWRAYRDTLTIAVNQNFLDFKSAVSSRIREAVFIDESQLKTSLTKLQEDLEKFLKSGSCLTKDTAGANTAEHPLHYNLLAKFRELVTQDLYLSSNWSQIFAVEIDNVTFNFSNMNLDDEKVRKTIASSLISSLEHKPKGSRGSNFQQSLEGLIFESKFTNLEETDKVDLTADEVIVQQLIRDYRGREYKSKRAHLDELLRPDVNDPHASEKMLMGLMQLIALGKHDSTKNLAVRRYISELLGTDLSRLDVSKLLGQDSTRSFENALNAIATEGVNSRKVGVFQRFAYLNSISFSMNEEIEGLRPNIEENRRSSLLHLVKPLIRILGKEGEHLSLIDRLTRSVEELAVDSEALEGIDDLEARRVNSQNIESRLKNEFRDITFRHTDNQWLEQLSSDHARLNILALILEACRELFNLKPAVNKYESRPAESHSSLTTQTT
jgi:hypothetical protein